MNHILDQLAIDLERLDQSMATARSHITTAKSLNNSGAKVLQNLVSILEE